MRQGRLRYFIILIILFGTMMCRKPYNPPAIQASNHFLAVDGFINTSVNSSSTFVIRRSLNLSDTIPNIPVLNAQVLILSATGSIYPLLDTGSNGTYVSDLLTLDASQQYQLLVTTNDGAKYLSDLVTSKAAPPIDSLTWQLIFDPLSGNDIVNIFVNSHDASNNTRYYRWDYVQTWQHQSTYESYWGAKNGLMYPIYPIESTHNCWSTGLSHSILLGSSVALSSDVISQALIATFLKDDPKMDVEYSILAKQYPLTLEAYNYWLTVQKNSQSLGGLFDLQPSQIRGNMHGVTNPNDPVLGFVSASSVQEQRLFITNKSLPGWKSNPFINCPIAFYATDPNNFAIINYPDTSFQVWYYVSGPPPVEKLTRKECLDCRFQGGSNIKPPYWP